jgi:hypothetical protein
MMNIVGKYLAAAILLFWAGSAVAQTTGGIGPLFTGTTAGGTTTYTLAPAQKGFRLVDGWVITAKINATNTGASTLNVNSTGAVAINKQNTAGITALSGGELVANREYDFVYSSAASAYIVTTNLAADVTSGATSTTITQAQWANGAALVISTASQTITLPVATSLSTNGSLLIQTVGVPATLTPNSADGINGGTINTSVVIPADATVLVTTSGSSGTGAFNAPLGPLQYFALSWAEGLNLSTNARYIGRVGTTRHVYGIKCNVQAAAGSASTVHVYSTASGTAPASGTLLDSTGCNANSASNTEQDMGVAGADILANYSLWAVFSGSGTSGNGGLNITFR